MMSLIDMLLGRKKATASLAKERLQIILAHERSGMDDQEDGQAPSWLPRLQQELVEVIARYVKINPQDLKVNLERKDNLELLEINVTLPEDKE